VLGQPNQFGVRAARSEDLGIVHSDYASPLPLKCTSHHGCAARLFATTHDLVDELDQIIVQSYSNLLAHTKMLPLWDQRAFFCDFVGPRSQLARRDNVRSTLG
jgi:hypothetical protein